MTMKLQDLRNELRQDPEYASAQRELKPLLDLADEILALRMERGWSQAELAQRVGTRQANISRIENGLGNPTYSFLQKLADAFGTELSIHVSAQKLVQHTTVVYVPVLPRDQVIASRGTIRRLHSPWDDPGAKPRRQIRFWVA